MPRSWEAEAQAPNTMSQMQQALASRMAQMTNVSGNLRNFYNTANAAAHGDQSAQGNLINDQLSTAMGTVRATPTGKILGTVEPEAMSSRQAVQANLRGQAKESGLEFGSQRAIPKQPEANIADVDINPAERPISVAEKVKARFGDKLSDDFWNKLDTQAKQENRPYVPILTGGSSPWGPQSIGFYPNEAATPTGEIGRPEDFISGNQHTIFHNDPLGWYDSKYGVTKSLLDQHSQAGIPANITTASDLIARDDYINSIPQGSRVNMILSSPLDQDFSSGSPMGNPLPSNSRILSAYDKLKKSGIDASVSIPDPDNNALKQVDPFTLRAMQNRLDAHYTPTEEGAE